MFAPTWRRRPPMSVLTVADRRLAMRGRSARRRNVRIKAAPPAPNAARFPCAWAASCAPGWWRPARISSSTAVPVWRARAASRGARVRRAKSGACALRAQRPRGAAVRVRAARAAVLRVAARATAARAAVGRRRRRSTSGPTVAVARCRAAPLLRVPACCCSSWRSRSRAARGGERVARSADVRAAAFAAERAWRCDHSCAAIAAPALAGTHAPYDV